MKAPGVKRPAMELQPTYLKTKIHYSTEIVNLRSQKRRLNVEVSEKVASSVDQTAFPIIWLITRDRKLLYLSSPGELEHGPLGVGAAGAHEHVLGVLNGGDGAGSEQDLLPCLLQVDDVNSIILLLEDVLLHSSLGVGRPEMGGGSQHLSDVIFLQGCIDKKKSL